MTGEQNKAIVRRFWEAFEADDQAASKEILSPDLAARAPSAPDARKREAQP